MKVSEIKMLISSPENNFNKSYSDEEKRANNIAFILDRIYDANLRNDVEVDEDLASIIDDIESIKTQCISGEIVSYLDYLEEHALKLNKLFKSKYRDQKIFSLIQNILK